MEDGSYLAPSQQGSQLGTADAEAGETFDSAAESKHPRHDGEVQNDAAPPDAEDSWHCPITQDVYYYPARLPSGHIYEFDAIVRWLGEYGTDPLTRENVELASPPPIEAELRARIAAWREEKVRYHMEAIEGLQLQRAAVESEDTDEDFDAITEHFESALEAHPRSHALHASLIHHLETMLGQRHGIEQAIELARSNATAAEVTFPRPSPASIYSPPHMRLEAEETARLQIEENLAGWTPHKIEDGEHQEQPQEWLGAAVTGVSFVANSHPVALWYAGKAVVKTAAMSAKTVAGYAMATSGTAAATTAATTGTGMGAAVAVGTTTGATAAVTSGSAAAVGAVSTTAAASGAAVSGGTAAATTAAAGGSTVAVGSSIAHAAVSGGTAAATTAATGGSTAAVGSAVAHAAVSGGTAAATTAAAGGSTAAVGSSVAAGGGAVATGSSVAAGGGGSVAGGVTAGALLVPLAVAAGACAVSSAVILSLPSKKKRRNRWRSAEQEGPTYDFAAGESDWTLIGGGGENVEAEVPVETEDGVEGAQEEVAARNEALEDGAERVRQLPAEAAEASDTAETEQGKGAPRPVLVRERGAKLTRAERREIERHTLEAMCSEAEASSVRQVPPR